MLDYRKAELGMFRMRVAVQDVDAIVAEVFSMFEEVAQNRDMDYILDSRSAGRGAARGPDVPRNDADESPLERLQVHARRRIIRVALQRGEGCFRIQVRDSGIGITPEQQKHIFERFYQGNESYAGSGIGLSIVQRIVELHQGTISLRSEPNRYSEFTITLSDDLESYPMEKRARENDACVRRSSAMRRSSCPKSGRATATGALPAEEPEEEKGGTILVAEANPDVARYIADHFRTRYHIVSVADGNEALERLKSLEPDLIIADRMLPGLDGLKLCQAVKQNIRTCHIPVVIPSLRKGVSKSRSPASRPERTVICRCRCRFRSSRPRFRTC